MASQHFPCILLVLTLSSPCHSITPQPPSFAQQKLTKLHFFFHDIPNGNHPTAVIIARPANQTTVGFGTLVMIDDPLTERPETGSRLVGRAQGMYAEASQSESSLLMSMTFSFTLQGDYNGSSLSVLGRYRVGDKEREMPVIGGSGMFRLARGYALAKTYQYDPKTGVAVSSIMFLFCILVLL